MDATWPSVPIDSRPPVTICSTGETDEAARDDRIVVESLPGASGAGYQNSWGMAIKAAERLEQALAANGIKLS